MPCKPHSFRWVLKCVSGIIKQNQSLSVTHCILNILILVFWNFKLDILSLFSPVFFGQIFALLIFACKYYWHLSTPCFSSVFLNCLFLFNLFQKAKRGNLRVWIGYGKSSFSCPSRQSQLFVPIKEDTYFYPLNRDIQQVHVAQGSPFVAHRIMISAQMQLGCFYTLLMISQKSKSLLRHFTST